MKEARKKLLVMLVVLVLITSGLIAWRITASEDVLRLATTTSTYDSGLLDEIIPHFEETYDVRVKIIAVGTKQALELGRRGDADVLLVHAPEMEEGFVEEGHGKYRYDVMYNEFVLVGPKDDPAGIEGMDDPTEAFEKVYDDQAIFCSRGDGSGTHIKEMNIWEKAGFDYNEIDDRDNEWYRSFGQGMGDTLRNAHELDAYTLTDEATYLSIKDEIDDLIIHVKNDSAMLNQYGVIPVNGAVHPELAEDFADWMISQEVQNMIDDYTEEGEKLFTANA